MVELEGADEGSFFPMVVPLTIGRWSLHWLPSGDAGSQTSVVCRALPWNLFWFTGIAGRGRSQQLEL